MRNEFKLFASWEELCDGTTVRRRALVGVYDSHAGAMRGIAACQGTLCGTTDTHRMLRSFEIEGDCRDGHGAGTVRNS
jgi:hypothetical protein